MELIAGLRLAHRIGVKNIHAFCDSQLVANQFSGDYEAKNDRMDAYLKIVRDLSLNFDLFELTKIPRSDNAPADALATLASTSDPDLHRIIPVESIDRPSIDLHSTPAVLADASPVPPAVAPGDTIINTPATTSSIVLLIVEPTLAESTTPDASAAPADANRSYTF